MMATEQSTAPKVILGSGREATRNWTESEGSIVCCVEVETYQNAHHINSSSRVHARIDDRILNLTPDIGGNSVTIRVHRALVWEFVLLRRR